MDKFESKVKPGGVLIYDTNGITRHPQRTDISVYTIDATEEAAKRGMIRMFNTMILGGYLSVRPVVKIESVIAGLRKSLPEKVIPANEKALAAGAELIKKVR
jgi:2-oxoglutarate ferredoxin oxidoreductase subunit gamma